MKHTLSLALLALGCGSSSEPTPHTTAIPDSGVEDTAPTPSPKRTLVQRSLLPGSPQNLLLDPSFRALGFAGYGLFLSFYDTFTAQVQPQMRVLGASPMGVTTPVALFRDPSATDEKSRGMISIALFLGGKGPFVARVWVSRSDVAGAPTELPDEKVEFRAAVTMGGSFDSRSYDLTRKDQKVFADPARPELPGRTWYLYEARIDDDLPSSSFFTVKLGNRGGSYMVTGPEVVPLGLLPGDSTMALPIAAQPRAVLPEERDAIRAWERVPQRFDSKPLPKLIPGKHAPLDG